VWKQSINAIQPLGFLLIVFAPFIRKINKDRKNKPTLSYFSRWFDVSYILSLHKIYFWIEKWNMRGLQLIFVVYFQEFRYCFCYLINTQPMHWNLKECIRRRVMKSLSANPYCYGAAKAAVESVWDVCYNDTEPYDRAPWL